MDLDKRYKDSDGVKHSIVAMVREEPEWAANRIQEGERFHARLKEAEKLLQWYADVRVNDLEEDIRQRAWEYFKHHETVEKIYKSLEDRSSEVMDQLRFSVNKGDSNEVQKETSSD